MIKSKWILTTGAILCVLLLISGVSVSGLFSKILIIGLIFFALSLRNHNKKRKSSKTTPKASRELEIHYQSLGLSTREIDVFRQTMNQVKVLIERLQLNMRNNSKLKAIDLRHDTTKAAKGLFKELVKEPQKLHYASQFLYTHLPNLVDLTDKYLEISNHEIKSKETYDKMEESIVVIDQLSALIAKDYSQFVSDDFDDLDVEISLAKQSLTQEKSNTISSED